MGLPPDSPVICPFASNPSSYSALDLLSLAFPRLKAAPNFFKFKGKAAGQLP